MALFIMAMTINPSAKKTYDDFSHQIDESLQLFSQSGVKMHDVFATLGRYDLLAVFEATDQADAFAIASHINRKGILDTETWPVIPYEDFSRLMK